MSVEHEAILAVGKWFPGIPEAIQFLKEQGSIGPDGWELIEEDGLEDTLPHLGLQGGILNYCTGDGFYIGYDIDIEDLDNSYYKGKFKWGNRFNVPSEVVLTVRTS